jgi:hypothetical protein
LIGVERRAKACLGGYALVSKQPRHGDERDESKLKSELAVFFEKNGKTYNLQPKS